MNTSHVENYIDQIIAEANAAAQAVYDKHQTELIAKIQRLLKPGQTVFTGMGSSHVENKKGDYILESLAGKLQNLQYPCDLSDSTVYIPSEITYNSAEG